MIQSIHSSDYQYGNNEEQLFEDNFLTISNNMQKSSSFIINFNLFQFHIPYHAF